LVEAFPRDGNLLLRVRTRSQGVSDEIRTAGSNRSATDRVGRGQAGAAIVREIARDHGGGRAPRDDRRR